MKTLVEKAFNSWLMGSFEILVSGYKPKPPTYKDKGCPRAKRAPYNYKGVCLECPLPKCLEDSIVGTENSSRLRKEVAIRFPGRLPGRPFGARDTYKRASRARKASS